MGSLSESLVFNATIRLFVMSNSVSVALETSLFSIYKTLIFNVSRLKFHIDLKVEKISETVVLSSCGLGFWFRGFKRNAPNAQ